MNPLQIITLAVDRILAYARNARTHSEEQIAQVAASIRRFGWTNPILIDPSYTVIAGHARLAAARQLGMTEVPCIMLSHLTPEERQALVLADNKLAMNAGWDQDMLRLELLSLKEVGFDLDVVGFSADELEALFGKEETHASQEGEVAGDQVPEAPANPVTRPGDTWLIGKHRLVCGDCREIRVVRLLFDNAWANVAITSPPYATQREYDRTSGFKPIPPDEYVEWYKAVAFGIESVLAPDGSYLLNIKEHASDGERSLYVKDLLLAHKRQWGWRFVDEFCWRKTDNGVPGGWNNRFKNAWEPVFHFCRQQQIKFRPEAVSHQSDDCFDYSPSNPKSTSGSGLLGTGARGDAAGKSGSTDADRRHTGMARPSNVIEAKTESTQGSHSAPFPRALVDFFLKAYSDAGDLVFDPFMGSGTVMASAHGLGRTAYGCEISPAYCDVILRRMINLAGTMPTLVTSGQAFMDVPEGQPAIQ